MQAWRARGDDRLDPIAFHVIEALARRVADQTGTVRQRLDERLAQLMQAYADRVAADEPTIEAGANSPAIADASAISMSMSALAMRRAGTSPEHRGLTPDTRRFRCDS
nr:DUF2894 domain-containing protein [Achromobacter sp. UMC71]